jgi:hypothetical protein
VIEQKGQRDQTNQHQHEIDPENGPAVQDDYNRRIAAEQSTQNAAPLYESSAIRKQDVVGENDGTDKEARGQKTL